MGADAAAPAQSDAKQVTALLLCGGQGSRMGGQDKGLLPLRGQPLFVHAMAAIRPQVSSVLISANRHLDRYAQYGAPVLPDSLPGFIGPLAGMLAGLEACPTPWMQCLPCDGPAPPTDLVARLLAATRSDAAAKQGVQAAVPLARRHDEAGEDSDGLRLQPTFALLHRDVAPDLRHFLISGGRKVGLFLQGLRLATVPFEREGDADGFANLNTPDDWRHFERVRCGEDNG